MDIVTQYQDTQGWLPKPLTPVVPPPNGQTAFFGSAVIPPWQPASFASWTPRIALAAPVVLGGYSGFMDRAVIAPLPSSMSRFAGWTPQVALASPPGVGGYAMFFDRASLPAVRAELQRHTAWVPPVVPAIPVAAGRYSAFFDSAKISPFPAALQRTVAWVPSAIPATPLTLGGYTGFFSRAIVVPLSPSMQRFAGYDPPRPQTQFFATFINGWTAYFDSVVIKSQNYEALGWSVRVPPGIVRSYGGYGTFFDVGRAKPFPVGLQRDGSLAPPVLAAAPIILGGYSASFNWAFIRPLASARQQFGAWTPQVAVAAPGPLAYVAFFNWAWVRPTNPAVQRDGSWVPTQRPANPVTAARYPAFFDAARIAPFPASIQRPGSWTPTMVPANPVTLGGYGAFFDTVSIKPFPVAYQKLEVLFRGPHPPLSVSACVIYGRGNLPTFMGMASRATIYGKDCACEGDMKVHQPEYMNVGDTWEIEGVLAYADGTPFDLGAGCDIRWAIQDSAGATTILKTLGSGITVIDPAAGTCLITVGPEDSDVVAIGNYTDQLRATDPTGYVSTQWTGPFNVRKSFFAP